MDNLKEMFEQNNYANTQKFSLNALHDWARVVHVYDGDTPTLVMNYNNAYYKFTTRLYGIDTMEMTSKDLDIKQKALLARQRLIQMITGKLIPLNATKTDIQRLFTDEVYLVWVECLQMDKYGRILINLKLNETDTTSINEQLIQEKLAVPYYGGTKTEKIL